MPGGSKKGGGLTVKKSALYKKQKFGEAKSPFTMTYKHSAFPFKESPMKLDEGTDYTPFTPDPTIGGPGVKASLGTSTGVQPHQHGKFNDPDAIVMPGDPNDPVMPGGRPDWY